MAALIDGWGMTWTNFEAVLFVTVGACTLVQLVKSWNNHIQVKRPEALRGLAGPALALAGADARRVFMGLVFLSNIVRAISLWILCYLEVTSTVRYETFKLELTVIKLFPSLLFISSYSLVTVFWAQVYYASILVNYPLLKPLSFLVNISVYIIFLSIAGTSYFFNSFNNYFIYCVAYIGILYCLTSIAFAYYGLNVTYKFNQRSICEPRKSGIIRRVLFLSVTCSLLFAVRGLYSVAYGLQIIEKYYPLNFDELTWDAIVYLISEWLPSLFILIAFWNRTRENKPLHMQGCAAPLMHDAYSPYNPQPMMKEDHIQNTVNEKSDTGNGATVRDYCYHNAYDQTHCDNHTSSIASCNSNI